MAEGGHVTLPKFGEWNVKRPSSCENYSAIFERARNEKKNGGKPIAPPETQQAKTGAPRNEKKNGGKPIAPPETQQAKTGAPRNEKKNGGKPIAPPETQQAKTGASTSGKPHSKKWSCFKPCIAEHKE